MTRCVYHCIPIGNSQSTYVRFNKVKFTTADYETWLLHYMALMCRHLSYVIDIKKTIAHGTSVRILKSILLIIFIVIYLGLYVLLTEVK